MPDSANFIFLLAESSIHAGTGAVLSHVDLPIQREAHTNHPIVYASGVKGALRDHCASWIEQQPDSPENTLEKRLKALFGPENPDEHGGQGIFQEARVLLFPVRSFKGVFAWVTCPYNLARLRRDLEAIGPGLQNRTAAGEFAALPAMTVADDHALAHRESGVRDENGRIVLEDYDFSAPEPTAEDDRKATLGAWLSKYAVPAAPTTGPDPYFWWREKLAKDVVILSDEDYRYMVETHTEIQTHVKIGKNGTVDKSGPWNEESLPPETLLYIAVVVPPVLAKAVKFDNSQLLALLEEALTGAPLVRLGGDRSLGKGLARATILK